MEEKLRQLLEDASKDENLRNRLGPAGAGRKGAGNQEFRGPYEVFL